MFAIRHAHGTATEHAEASEDRERQWYTMLAETLLRTELLPAQKNGEAYRIRYNNAGCAAVTKKQRSWVGSMLRKYLGGKPVGVLFHIAALPS